MTSVCVVVVPPMLSFNGCSTVFSFARLNERSSINSIRTATPRTDLETIVSRHETKTTRNNEIDLTLCDFFASRYAIPNYVVT